MKHKQRQFLYMLGRPFAPFYGLIMTLRAAFYRMGIFRTKRLDVPVISVGNLTMGGTGKTPMTIYLAGLLRDRDPVVVSRSYRGSASRKINVVSNRNGLLMDVETAGDEPCMLAGLLPGISVVTGPSKGIAAEYACRHLHPGLIIVDDGLQHLRLARDLNMVLFKVDMFFGNNRVFPGGDMREPLSALKRADCFVLNCVDDDNRSKAEAIERALEKKFPRTPIFKAAYRPVAVVGQNGRKLGLEEEGGRKYFGFCGLADPSSFKKILENTSIELTGFRAYPDHYDYSAKDLSKIEQAAEATGAEALITTEKDMVKIRGKLTLPVVSVSMDLFPFEGLADFVRSKING